MVVMVVVVVVVGVEGRGRGARGGVGFFCLLYKQIENIYPGYTLS